MDMIYETNFTMFDSYYDFNNKLRPIALLGMFQDIAAHHGNLLGLGYHEMLKKNLYWVLSRVKYDILKTPEIGQIVKAVTWPHEKGLIDFDRDFLVLDQQNNVLIKGTSKWCVINCNTRMLTKAENVTYPGIFSKRVNYTERFNKTPMQDVSGLSPVLTHTVQFSDLDHNEHMNNTMYANLVINAIVNKTVNSLQLNFINECKLNDQINVYLVKTDAEYVYGYVLDKLVFSAKAS